MRRALRALLGTRPAVYSRSLWALLIALDFLPWPLGEDILAALFAGVGLVRGSRRRMVVAWAAQQSGRRDLRLAAAVSAFRGRWVARSALLGMRRLENLRRHIVVVGEERLMEASGPTILLGFHLGPPNADVALRVLGHPMAWLGTTRQAPAWSRDPWRSFLDPRENLSPPDEEWFWPGYLYRARRMLLDGGTLFIMADSWIGRELFRVPLPGGPAVIRSGWLILQRQTGARVLPVSTHLEGRTQLITIHPPLPPPTDADDVEACRYRPIVSELMAEYLRRFPEQCPVLAFPPTVLVRSRPRADGSAPATAGRVPPATALTRGGEGEHDEPALGAETAPRGSP
jgi:lauroyl/myristoyl acyltransferase